MNDDMDRDTPAHFPAAAYGFRSIIIFVTVCAKDRKSIFANEAAHALIVDAWRRANGWFVGRNVVMPDHVHFFCSPGMDEPPALKQWVRYWKTTVSRRWGSSSEQPIWQVDFWDSQLRKGESYSAKWEYVRANPVRAGLVPVSGEWPYQGEMNVLSWHD